MHSRTGHTAPLDPATTARRPRIIATTVVVAATLAVTGCTAHATTRPSPAPVTSAPPVTSASRTPASTETTRTTGAIPARARCALSPTAGPAGSRTTLTCSGFAPSEPVAVRFAAVVLTTTSATATGTVRSSLQVPDGFAGSHYPGRQDTFRVEGRRSGRVASATFTVTG
jgi:hypothetical protein